MSREPADSSSNCWPAWCRKASRLHLAGTAMPLFPRRGPGAPGRAAPAAQHGGDAAVEIGEPVSQILGSRIDRPGDPPHCVRVDTQAGFRIHSGNVTAAPRRRNSPHTCVDDGSVNSALINRSALLIDSARRDRASKVRRGRAGPTGAVFLWCCASTRRRTRRRGGPPEQTIAAASADSPAAAAARRHAYRPGPHRAR